jgi:hypothetical protein
LAAITYSCSKQDQAEPVSSTTEISQSDADILMENKIRAFKSKMEFQRENPSYKSGEKMSVDSAVWYMEAASNYTYGDVNIPFGKLVVDSFDIDVAASNGEVNLNDLFSAYDEMIYGISESFDAIIDEKRHLVVNDVSIKTEEGGTATFSVIAGFGVEESAGTSGYFNHDWYYGMLAGDCDFNNPGTDAAEKIEDKILLLKGTPGPNVKYTDVETFEIHATSFLNTEDLEPYNNMYDYLMFSCWDDFAGIMPNVHTCVSVEEMNFYYLGTNYVLNHDQPQFARPPGKSLITVDLMGDAVYGMDGTLYMHHALVQYGIPYVSAYPPE